MKVCRICLSKDGRLYPISSNCLRSLYHLLIGVIKVKGDVDRRLPQWVCAECGLRLMSYNKLRQKSLRSHQILTKLLDKTTHITEEDINNIDREKNNLKSSLISCTLNVIQCQETDAETDCIPIVEFIKTEKDEYITETAVSHTESISDCESYVYFEVEETSLSDNSASSVKKLKKSVSPKLKHRRKKVELDSKKSQLDVIKTVVDNNVNSDLKEDIFSVRTISWEEQLVEFKRRKYSKNYIEAPFKCNDCFKGFSSKETFTRHKLIHSDVTGKIECKICKSRFRTKKAYLPHMIAHKTLYSCNKCDFTTRQRCVAARHRLTHQGKIYKCPHCDLEFANQSSYLSHVRIKHVSQFVCEYCGYSFVSAKGVNFHKIKKHTLEKKMLLVTADGPSCAPCNIKFVTDEALSTHLRVSHSITSEDDKKTYNSETYRRKKKILTCELCGAMTADFAAYKNHFRCQHPSRKPSKLPTTAPKSALQFVCEQCGRVFQTKFNLLKHALVHTEQRPFECHDCHKRFKSKLRVQAHIIKVHLPKKLNNVKVYGCGICEKEFSQNSSRKRHIMAVHLGLSKTARLMTAAE